MANPPFRSTMPHGSSKNFIKGITHTNSSKTILIELVVQRREISNEGLRCRICFGNALRDKDFRDESILDDKHQVLFVKNLFVVSIQCAHHMPITVMERIFSP